MTTEPTPLLSDARVAELIEAAQQSMDIMLLPGAIPPEHVAAIEEAQRDGRDTIAALRELESLRREREELRAVLALVPAVVSDAYRAWDGDKEMRVGKILLALMGKNKGYRQDTDKICATITGETK